MQAIRDWADPVSVETLRIDVDAKRKQVDLWLIVDLPLDAQFQVASIATMMPEHLRDNPLIDVLRAHLGPDYSATVRYQTRIAGRVDLLNRAVDDAPSVEDADDDSTPGDGL